MKKYNLIYDGYYKNFFKTILTKLSFILPVLILFSIFITGFIFTYFIDENIVFSTNMNNIYHKPSLKYPLGTNALGQNQIYLTFIGAYKTLLLAFIATTINTLIGIVIGVLWGSSSKFNNVMFLIKNLIDNTPMIFVYIIIIAFLGDGFIPLLLVVILFGWLETATLIRNNITIIKNKDYNQISRLYKVPLHKIAINNYLPSILPILFNRIALCVPQVIALEITISYFGFSTSSKSPSLGVLLYNTLSNNSFFNHPFMFFVPFIFLFIINLCIHIISKTISINFTKEEI